MKKSISLTCLLIVIITLLKLSALATAAYDDEAQWTSFTADFSFSESSGNGFIFPPLGLYIFQFFAYVFGLSSITMRLATIIFSLVNLALIYFLAKEIYNKRIALLSVGITSLSFYYFLASLQIDVEGSSVLFMFLMFSYSFIKFRNTSQKNWLILTGVFLGLAMLIKSGSILLLPIIGLYLLFTSNNLLKSIFDAIKIAVIGISLFAVFPILTTFYNMDVSHVFGYGSRLLSLNLSLLSPIMFLFWATPLLIGLTLLAFWKSDKTDYFLMSWIFVIFIFFGFCIIQRDFSRYFMNLIPPMAILGAKFIDRFNFSKKDIFNGSLVMTGYLFILFVINSLPLRYVSRLMSEYLIEIKYFNFNFLFSYTTSSGPSFGVSFAIIALTICLSFGFILALILFRKNKNLSKICFIMFLAISIAFNIFLIQEYVFHTQGPDPSAVTYELVEFFNEENLTYPVYTNDEGIEFYLDNNYWANTRTDDRNLIYLPDNELDMDISYAVSRVELDRGTILLLNWPKIPHNSPLWNVTEKCNLIKTLYSKNYELGYVYNCI